MIRHVNLNINLTLKLKRERTQTLNLMLKNGFLVSKETVVLRWLERSKQKFGFIKRVDKG